MTAPLVPNETPTSWSSSSQRSHSIRMSAEHMCNTSHTSSSPANSSGWMGRAVAAERCRATGIVPNKSILACLLLRRFQGWAANCGDSALNPAMNVPKAAFYSCPGAHSHDPLARNDETAFSDATHWPDGQITKIPSSPARKNIPLNPSGKSALLACPVSPDERGVAQRHERAVGCGGRGGAVDEMRFPRTAKSCGPGAPVLASSCAGSSLRGDGGKKAGHRGATVLR